MTWKCTNTPKGENKLYSDAKGVVPSLDLRFAEGKNLNDYMTGQNLITFSRPVGANQSPGTYVDENGIIQLSSADTPRFDHNPTTGESLGLLIEESRTNILLNSATLSTQSVTTSATAYTLSFYGTGTVTLSGTSTAGPLAGTGANDRVTLTFTPTAGTLTLTVTGTVSNAQLEAGSFPTSYIPTTGTALTRSADTASITGSNFSSWYNPNQGTIYAKNTCQGIGVQKLFWTLKDSLNNSTDYIGLFVKTSGQLRAASNKAGVLQLFLNGIGAITEGDNVHTAVALQENNCAFCTDGGSVLTDTTVLLNDNLERLLIGYLYDPTVQQLTGHIARLTYFPDRLADATLQAITAP